MRRLWKRFAGGDAGRPVPPKPADDPPALPTWEEAITLNPHGDVPAEALPPAAAHLGQRDGSVAWDEARLPLAEALSRDTAPLPTTAQREGYYGDNHFNYWASGVRDCLEAAVWLEQHGTSVRSVLDLGCATGRVLRAFHFQAGASQLFGCDINRAHVDWINRHLPPDFVAFQNSSLPTLPLPSASLDLVLAFSVFTHVETFDTTWLMELRRVLRPGGVAWVTIHGDRTWQGLQPHWPLAAALADHPDYLRDRAGAEIPRDRVVYRWHRGRSYSANVFYREDYVRRVWSRFLTIAEIRPATPPFQDIVVLCR